jgi:hypothetical protein
MALFVGDDDEPILIPMDFLQEAGITNVDWRAVADRLYAALGESMEERLLAVATYEDAVDAAQADDETQA